MSMNKYGAQAKSHWQKWLPKRYAKITDPDAFFRSLGEEIEIEVDELSRNLAGEDPPGEGFLDKLGRLNMARQQAEERVLRELALLGPESETEETASS